MNDDRRERGPVVLLIEDDPVGGRFLHDALAPERTVVWVRSGGAARTAAGEHPVALALIDLQLPDTSGASLFAQLRAGPMPAPIPALAMSAELDSAQVAALTELGFAGCLAKPIDAAALRRAVAAAITGQRLPRPEPQPAVWDDRAALRALGGKQDALRSLRGLLRQDLAGQRARIVEAARSDRLADMRSELHRLRAACGFCGAAQLATCCADLVASTDPATLQRFEQAVEALLADR